MDKEEQRNNNCTFFHFKNGSRVVFRLRVGDKELKTSEITVDVYADFTAGGGKVTEQTVTLDTFLLEWLKSGLKDKANG